MEGKRLSKVAEEYLEKGYSIIPIKEGDKKPAIRWQAYQTQKAGLDEVSKWYSPEGLVGPRGNIAIVTGRISNCTVIDVDPRHGGLESAKLLGLQDYDVVTGGGGYHLYFCYDSVLCSNMAGSLPGIDVRSEGGYVLAPPSTTIGEYSWLTAGPQRNTSLPAIPKELLERLSINKRRCIERTSTVKISGKAGTICSRPIEFLTAVCGERNNTAAIMAGRILQRYDPSYDNGLSVLRLWNHGYCNPKLDDDELQLVYNSIWRKHRNDTKQTGASR